MARHTCHPEGRERKLHIRDGVTGVVEEDGFRVLGGHTEDEILELLREIVRGIFKIIRNTRIELGRAFDHERLVIAGDDIRDADRVIVDILELLRPEEEGVLENGLETEECCFTVIDIRRDVDTAMEGHLGCLVAYPDIADDRRVREVVGEIVRDGEDVIVGGIVLVVLADGCLETLVPFGTQLLLESILKLIKLCLCEDMDGRIGTARERSLCPRIDTISVKFQPGERENNIVSNITVRAYDITREVIHIRDDVRGHRAGGRDTRLGRLCRYIDPVLRSVDHAVCRDESGVWTEGLVVREFVEYLDRTVGIHGAAGVVRSDREGMVDGVVDREGVDGDDRRIVRCDRSARVRVLAVGEIARDGLHGELGRDRHVRPRYREVEYKQQETDGECDADDKQENIRVRDEAGAAVDARPSLDPVPETRGCFFDLVDEVLADGEVMPQDVLLREGLLELNGIITIKILHAEGLADLADVGLRREEDKLLIRKRRNEEFDIQVVSEDGIFTELDAHLARSAALRADAGDDVEDSVVRREADRCDVLRRDRQWGSHRRIVLRIMLEYTYISRITKRNLYLI